MTHRRIGTLAVWLGCIALAAVIVARARYITDMSAFLPARPTPQQRLLIDQLRDGPASRLILAALQGGSADRRAKLITAIALKLRSDSQYAAINDGDSATADQDRRFLFEHRYLLSDAVDPAHFSPIGLHTAIEETIDSFSSSAGLLLKSLLPDDPTGEMLHMLDQLETDPQPVLQDGVWMSADASRTLLIAQTAAAGSDTDAQEHAIESIRAAFAAAVHDAPTAAGAPVELRLSGPAVFAVAARAKIKNAAVRLSLLSSALVISLLLAVYRSLPALLLGLLPVASGALAGVAAVATGFGAVHGITLGFGVTLIGESVDYAIYFFIQSHRDGDAAASWQRQWWPTIRLGMLTSVCGFASLLPSGFPGLAQLGLYSISGLIAAAMVTRYVLPALLPKDLAMRDVAPLGGLAARGLAHLRGLSPSVLPLLCGFIALCCLAALYAHRSTLWNRELSALSPVSREDLTYDAQLRSDLGGADVGVLVIVSATTLESALQGAEAAGRVLESLSARQVIGGFDSPARYLPSLATQRARRDSLPAAPQLRANLALATAESSLGMERLEPFLRDVEQARRAPLLTARSLEGTALEAGFHGLMMHRSQTFDALLPLHAAGRDIDAARIRAALEGAGISDARVLDIGRESNVLYADYLREAIHLSLAGLLALLVLLTIVLRSPSRVARVLTPLILAVLVVDAAFALTGVQLTILHLVGMLLIVAVGSNYALFFDRQTALRERAHEPAMLASLLIANASTVLGFGLLSFSQVPVLVALGTTVAPGAFLALFFAAALSSNRA